MTFDEWATANGLDELADHDGVVSTARIAWAAATAAERKRCAAVVVQYGLADDAEALLGLLTETAGVATIGGVR